MRALKLQDIDAGVPHLHAAGGTPPDRWGMRGVPELENVCLLTLRHREFCGFRFNNTHILFVMNNK